MLRANLLTGANVANPQLMMNGPSGPPSFVPISVVKADLTHGDELTVMGGFVANAHLSGYNSEYFSAEGLVITKTDITGQTNVDLNDVTWLGNQDGGDAWNLALFGGNTNPYCRHFLGAGYTVPANGTYFIAMLGWATSSLAGAADWVGVSYPYLHVQRFAQQAAA